MGTSSPIPSATLLDKRESGILLKERIILRKLLLSNPRTLREGEPFLDTRRASSLRRRRHRACWRAPGGIPPAIDRRITSADQTYHASPDSTKFAVDL